MSLFAPGASFGDRPSWRACVSFPTRAVLARHPIPVRCFAREGLIRKPCPSLSVSLHAGACTLLRLFISFRGRPARTRRVVMTRLAHAYSDRALDWLDRGEIATTLIDRVTRVCSVLRRAREQTFGNEELARAASVCPDAQRWVLPRAQTRKVVRTAWMAYTAISLSPHYVLASINNADPRFLVIARAGVDPASGKRSAGFLPLCQ